MSRERATVAPSNAHAQTYRSSSWATRVLHTAGRKPSARAPVTQAENGPGGEEDRDILVSVTFGALLLSAPRARTIPDLA